MILRDGWGGDGGRGIGSGQLMRISENTMGSRAQEDDHDDDEKPKGRASCMPACLPESHLKGD